MTPSQRAREQRELGIVADYQSREFSIEQIMERHGIARSTIFNVCARRGVTRKRIGKTQLLIEQLMARAEAAESRAEAAEAERDAMRSVVVEVGSSGVEFDDDRLRYVTIQLDRDTWTEAVAIAKAAIAAAGEQKG